MRTKLQGRGEGGGGGGGAGGGGGEDRLIEASLRSHKSRCSQRGEHNVFNDATATNEANVANAANAVNRVSTANAADETTTLPTRRRQLTHALYSTGGGGSFIFD